MTTLKQLCLKYITEQGIGTEPGLDAVQDDLKRHQRNFERRCQYAAKRWLRYRDEYWNFYASTQDPMIGWALRAHLTGDPVAIIMYDMLKREHDHTRRLERRRELYHMRKPVAA